MFLRATWQSSFFSKAGEIHSVFPQHRMPRFSPTNLKLFATDADVLKKFQKSQVNRVSVLEPRANELIKAIRIKDFEKAKLLVNAGVNVDGHTSLENTPLTDAAKRGDTKGVEFLLKNLKANPHASCDCPHHKTALHYAAENGHLDTVNKLLEYGANPNVLDSRRYSAIDLATTLAIMETLKLHGGNDGKMIAQDDTQLRKFLPK